MADAFNFDLFARIVFGDEESPPFTLRQQIGSRQEIAGDGLQMASAEATARNKIVI